MSRLAAVGWLVLVLALAAAFAGVPVAAQTAMATARGTVVDEQGGVLPGVTVTVAHVDTRVARTVTTDDRGRYFLPNLPPGTYEVTAELAGFATERRQVVFRIGQEGTVDFGLRVGTVEENVLVSAQAALVDTQHVVGAHLDTKALDELPTLTRDFADLAQLAPGVLSRDGSGSGFTAGGARQYQNNIVVDGATNVMQFYGSQADAYPQDWIQEFQVMTSGASVEFGQAIGGIVNVVTRSGTNDFTGRAYGYIRDDVFDSPPFGGTFVDNEPVFLDETPPFDQQRLGGFIGGPIRKNRLFYFAGVESLENDGTRILSISPYWRENGGPGSGGPAGQSNGPNGSGFDAIVPTKNISRAFLVRGDWQMSNSHTLTARHNRTIREDVNCTGQGGDACAGNTAAVLEKSARFEGPIWSVLGNVTSTLNDSMFNEGRLYYGVNKRYILGNFSNGLYGRDLLEQNADGRFAQSTYPGVQIGQSTTSGLEGETNFYASNTFTLFKGGHQLKVGATIARVTMHMDIDASQKGRWTFPVDRVFSLGDPASYPDVFSGAVGFAQWTESKWNYQFFVEDSWRLSPSFTLNAGVRYDVDNTITVGNELVDAYNARVIARQGGGPVAEQVPSDLDNIAPRVGFAWVPTGSRRTTIRGSAGIVYDQNHFNYADVYLNQTLLAQQRVQFNANSPTENPFCTGGTVTNACRDALRSFLAQSYPAFPPLAGGRPLPEFFNGLSDEFRLPWTASFSVGVSHAFPSNLTLQVDYAHNRGEDIILGIDANVASIEDGRVTVHDPRFTQILQQVNAGFIRYHALLTRAEWRGTRLRAGASYTLSNCRSNSTATGVGGGNATNPLDLSVDEGPCNEDQRHNVALDGSYAFPADVQFAAIYRAASALPYFATSRFVVFALPEPRNSRRGDSRHNLDLRVSKQFALGRGLRVSAFWEMFNALNTRNFTSYQGSLEAFNFGQPRSILAMRRQQLGVRFDF